MTICEICGCAPRSLACYHICPNSVCYYSPEQERLDDAHYGDDDMSERFSAEAEIEPPVCTHETVQFTGHIAAPGYGLSWECFTCKEPFWSASSGSKPVPYSSMKRPPELSIEDVI